ncbi:MAG TPA: dihydropteroate synthase [Blastocatellia bacterium]|nr:dihydropteroate synthase [Blastocatellia bacterium]
MSGTKQPRSVQVIVSRELSGSREYLLLLRRRRGVADFWQPVSGSLEGDESFAAAALRELGEETGLSPCAPLVDIGLVNRFRIAEAWRDLYAADVTHNVQVAFAASVGDGAVTLDRSEHVDYRWSPHAEARELVLYEPNRRAIDLVESGFVDGRRRVFDLQTATGTIALGRRTLIMGVLNVTPDSFSDGGLFASPSDAIDCALRMEADGADIIDVGGESSRPGAYAVPPDVERDRVIPVVRELSRRLRIPISIDTVRASTAAAALDAGASIVNDISGLTADADMASTVARARAAIVLMHMRGDPATMQKLPPSPDIIADVEKRLLEAMDVAADAGIALESILLDPGIGFGKTADQNVELIAHLSRVASLDRPVLVGTSRKAFLGHLTGRGVEERLAATTASVAASVMRGAHVVRVHDVAAAVDAARVADAVVARSNL